MADREVHDRPERSRYEITVDDRVVGIATYDDVGQTRIFVHTEVERSMRGRGVSAELIRAALDDVRSSGRHVIAQCPTVAQFIDTNPEYADLLVA